MNIVRQLLLGSARSIYPTDVPGAFVGFDAFRSDTMTLASVNQVSSWTDFVSNTAYTQGTGTARPLFDGSWVSCDGIDDSLAFTGGVIAGYPLSGSLDFVGIARCLSAPGDAGAKTLFAYPNSGVNGMTLNRGVVAAAKNTLGITVGSGAAAPAYTCTVGAWSTTTVFRVTVFSGQYVRFVSNGQISYLAATAPVPLFGGSNRYRLFANAASSAGAFGFFGLNFFSGFAGVISDASWQGISNYLNNRTGRLI